MVVKSVAAAALIAMTSTAASPIWKEGTAKRSGGFNFGDFGFGNFGDFGSFGSESSSVSHSSSFSGGSHVSFDGWGGFHSLDNFDNFYGAENFCGLEASSVTVVKQQEELVCHSVSVEIIQQQLAIIREYVKKIITTQICEVETQTIVFSQFQAGISGFSDDIRHHSSRHVGFDSNIASQITHIHDESGELSTTDLGFTGQDIGSNMVYPSGFNWVDSTSPSSVDSAYDACVSAATSSGQPDALPPPPPSGCTSDCDAPPPPSDCGSGCDAAPSDSAPPSDCGSGCDATPSDSAPPSDSTLAPPVDVPTNTTATATDDATPPPTASGDSSSDTPNAAND